MQTYSLKVCLLERRIALRIMLHLDEPLGLNRLADEEGPSVLVGEMRLELALNMDLQSVVKAGQIWDPTKTKHTVASAC